MKIIFGGFLAGLVWLSGAFVGIGEIVFGEVTSYRAYCAQGERILPLVLLANANALRKTRLTYEQALEKAEKDRETCNIITLGQTTYKINKTRGEIYYKLGGEAAKLVNCAIYSRTEWTCEYPDYGTGAYDRDDLGSGKVTFVNGRRALKEKDVRAERRYGMQTFYMRRWQWWTARLLGTFFYSVQSSWLIPDQEPAL